MTDEQRAAIDEAHRCFVVHLIASNVRQMRDRRTSHASRYYARLFLESDLCVCFVRLLGLGAGMSDEEIAQRLSGAEIEIEDVT